MMFLQVCVVEYTGLIRRLLKFAEQTTFTESITQTVFF